MILLHIRPPQDDPFTFRVYPGSHTLGRSSKADVALRDSLLSRLHARLTLDEGDVVTLTDLGSHNGTFLNGRRLDAATVLKSNDRITLGDTTLTLEVRATSSFVVRDETGPMASVTFVPSESLQQSTAGSVSLLENLLERRSKVLKLLLDVSNDLLQDRSQAELFDLILRRLFDVLDVDRGVILMKDVGGGLVQSAVRFGLGLARTDVTLSRRIVEAVTKEGRGALFVGSASSDGQVAKVNESMQQMGVSSCLAAPISVDGEVVGMVYLDVRLQRRQFDEEDLRVVTAVANSLAVKVRTLKQEEERRRVEEMRLSRDAAHAANSAKSAFIASMSHELRTPLNAIIGYSEMVQEGLLDDGLARHVPDLEKITAASKHLLTLINDVLDLSKIEAGRMMIVPATFDVAPIVAEAAASVRPLLEQNRNSLRVEGKETLGSMDSDSTRLRQVLLNLLSNAAKFTEDGAVTLLCRRMPTAAGDALHFVISDTGIGMTTEQLTRLFQPFSQADASTSKKYGGTGLGLAISRQLCRLMGGDISVDSELGKGTSFTVRLPAESTTRTVDSTEMTTTDAIRPA